MALQGYINKMRILLVHDVDKEVGGAETVLLQTKLGLESVGNSVKILAGHYNGASNSFADYSFQPHDTSPLGKLIFHTYNPYAVKALKAAITDFKPDVIHYHSVSKLSVGAIHVNKEIPKLMTFHDYGLFWPQLREILPKKSYCGLGDGACCIKHVGPFRFCFERFRTYLFHINRRNISYYIAPSTFMGEVALKLGYSPVQVIPNPLVQQHILGEIQKSINHRLLFVGRLEAEKGTAELLHAFSLVSKQFPDSKLIIAGDGSEKNALLRLSALLELTEKVTFIGQVNRKRLFKEYAMAQLVIIPSLWPEPFGLVGIEALSTGTPVIASGRGGMDWLNDGVNGLMIDPDDQTSFGTTIIKLFSDDARYIKLAKGTKTTSSIYSLESYTSSLTQRFDAVLPVNRALPLK